MKGKSIEERLKDYPEIRTASAELYAGFNKSVNSPPVRVGRFTQVGHCGNRADFTLLLATHLQATATGIYLTF